MFSLKNHFCSEEQYLCKGGRTCIHKTFLCDGVQDCPQGDDEEDCLKQQQCPQGLYQCRNNGAICIPYSVVCDVFHECIAGDQKMEDKCRVNRRTTERTETTSELTTSDLTTSDLTPSMEVDTPKEQVTTQVPSPVTLNTITTTTTITGQINGTAVTWTKAVTKPGRREAQEEYRGQGPNVRVTKKTPQADTIFNSYSHQGSGIFFINFGLVLSGNNNVVGNANDNGNGNNDGNNNGNHNGNGNGNGMATGGDWATEKGQSTQNPG